MDPSVHRYIDQCCSSKFQIITPSPQSIQKDECVFYVIIFPRILAAERERATVEKAVTKYLSWRVIMNQEGERKVHVWITFYMALPPLPLAYMLVDRQQTNPPGHDNSHYGRK